MTFRRCRHTRPPLFALMLIAVAAGGVAEAKQSATPPGPKPKQAAPVPAPRIVPFSLVPFFQALAALERGGGKPVSILQIGDSHTAGDYLSARLRELFQGRFGAAGRGWLPAGLADRYYDPKLVSVMASAGWSRSTARAADPAGPLGVGLLSQTASSSGEVMTLTAQEAAGFDRAFVEVAQRAGGGALQLSIDGGTPVAYSTAGTGARWIEVARPHARQLRLETLDDRGVEILSWGVERAAHGVLYQNFGLIGATAAALGRLDPRVLAAELGRRPPALIVVAFGTNEAFQNLSDLQDYAGLFADGVTRLSRAAPGASIVILGPPDVQRRDVAGRSCNPAPVSRPARRNQPAPPPPASGGWIRPVQLDRVIAEQKAAASRHGWFYWDWSEAMGGACAMHRWAGQALGRGDHVHFTEAGYRESAELLFRDLMQSYADFRGQQPRPDRRPNNPEPLGSDF